jgi:DMSO reductase family type II enzyme heme b subunit
VKVSMLPQTVTLPNNAEPAVGELTVRAVHNGVWIAFLIEWGDKTLSDRVVLDNFGDQVAVELPVDARAGTPPPSPMMGNPGGRVNIMQWRAAFQHDLDAGPPTVRSLYPNAWADVYPDEVLGAADARPYSGALGIENPISRGRASPVLDQMAEGWGTMTVKPDQHALGKGVWKDGRWRVVITRPMASDDVNAPRLAPGDRTVAAFAVWDGGGREVGARKSWASWVPLVIAR